MGIKCTVCQHPDVDSINLALVSGQSNRSLAAQYNLAITSIRRHKANHIPEHMSKAKEIEVIASATTLVDQTRGLLKLAQEITDESRSEGDHRTALMGIARIKDIIELLMKVTGELEEKTEINILINPQFQQIQTIIMRELEPYPSIKERIALALTETDSCR